MREPKAGRATDLHSKLRAVISGRNSRFFVRDGVHFETSVSICNVSPCELDVPRVLLKVRAAVLTGFVGRGKRSASDFLTPGDTFITT